MSQHDYALANDTGANVRSDLNNALGAIATNNSGGSNPATTFAYQWFANTTKGQMLLRNAANSGYAAKFSLSDDMVQAKSGNYTVLETDLQRLFVCSGTFTFSLTAASTMGDGWWFALRNNGTGIITIDPNASETIDGATTQIVCPGEAATVWCDGSAWYSIGLDKGPVLIQSQTASSSGSIDFTTGFSFARYVCYFEDVVPATDTAELWVRTSTSAGSSWSSGASDYSHVRRSQNTTPGGGDGGAATDSKIVIATNLGNGTAENVNGKIEFGKFDGSLTKHLIWEASQVDAAPNFYGYKGWGRVATSSVVNGLRFIMSTGNISSGRFMLYGMRA